MPSNFLKTQNRLEHKPSETFDSQQKHDYMFEKIVILGCGYVGSALASFWHQKSNKFVTVTTTREERIVELQRVAERVVVMTTDEVEVVQSLVEDGDVIVVSIAPVNSRQVSADVYAETYLTTARNLVAALSKTYKPTQVIYLSSCSVYGDRQGDWVDENSPIAPSDGHGMVLAEAEKIILEASSDRVKVCLLRMGGIYGPDRDLSERISKLAGKTMPGTGENFVNWIHIEDIVGAVDFIRENRCQGIYNLVNDVKLTLRELCENICQHNNVPQVVWDASQTSTKTNSSRVSNRKLKEAGYNLIYPQLWG
ncbi:MAG: SDR family oxidoreductase [Xenococcaceae cyanobacterium]